MSQRTDIILVEDNEDDANLIIRALKPYIHEKIIWMKDGEQVLSFFNEKNSALPKVIFLDLKMPKIGGIEVLTAIKSDHRTRYIPTVILTSSHESSDLEICYNLGANSYVVKPIDFDKLVKVTEGLGQYWLQLNEPMV